MTPRSGSPIGPGRALTDAVMKHYVLLPHEVELLRQAATVADQIAVLDALVEQEGVTVPSPQGVRAHPALVEARNQRIVLARIFTALQLPILLSEGERVQRTQAGRKQRRGGVRKPYAIGGGS